ncbi:MAG: ornithine carbamoyltransferase [Chloroflexi bacterium]|nr:ornithine carbamoyltransferase [Chloroflexota bacterium]
MKGKDLLSVADLSALDIQELISDAVEIKAKGWNNILKGKTLALLFEKPSLRTRASFEMAMRQLGGQVIYFSPNEVGLGNREPIPDVARVLSRYVDAIAARTFHQQTLDTLAVYADIPVINALSDIEHPCQALADLLTIYENKGDLAGLNLAYIGDGNNVASSLVLAAALSGINFTIASPPNYRLPPRICELAQDFADSSKSRVDFLEDPAAAIKDADVIYTDVWVSMGQEEDADKRRHDFAEYQLNEKLLALAKESAIIMHPLPAHYGEEVAEGILDHPASVVFDQAENRLHIQKALLAEILGGLEVPLVSYL